MVETEVNARLIEEEGNKRLQQSLYPELKKTVCTFRHGILTLYGVVSSFHVRQIAQELIQGISGIEIIDNQLVVATNKNPPKPSEGSGGKSKPAAGDGKMSDGAGPTGLEEPILRKSPGEGQPGPASADAQTQ
jgi:hypothetical protein